MSANAKKILYRLSLIGLGKERNFFLENFANLLLSGMPLSDAMTFVAEEVQNKTLKKIVEKMAVDIQSGLSLAEAMEQTELFSAHVISLVRIGQES